MQDETGSWRELGAGIGKAGAFYDKEIDTTIQHAHTHPNSLSSSNTCKRSHTRTGIQLIAATYTEVGAYYTSSTHVVNVSQVPHDAFLGLFLGKVKSKVTFCFGFGFLIVYFSGNGLLLQQSNLSQTANITPTMLHASCFMLHASYLIPHTSYLISSLATLPSSPLTTTESSDQTDSHNTTLLPTLITDERKFSSRFINAPESINPQRAHFHLFIFCKSQCKDVVREAMPFVDRSRLDIWCISPRDPNRG